ncbi:MAG: hypothetical protein FJ293_15185 [Planctomycetes bacterium]|nr:hypothetical protein [Planctomycetota bacterium]
MASFDPQARSLVLRFLVCGPTHAGKSEVLARLRERVGSRQGDGAHDLQALPLQLPCGGSLLLELFELEPLDVANAATEALVRCADGALFVADPRRERLRDNLIAYAWLLERLRAAARVELPGVLLLNRRDGEDLVGARELESVIGSGRFPSFNTDALRGEEVARTVLELLRRGATRAHVELALDQQGIGLAPLLHLLDEASSRPALLAAAEDATAPVAEPMTDPVFAPKRSPLHRYVRRLLLEQSRHARERRRFAEQADLVDEEARRPLQFLRSLFAHLERQGPRLPPSLEEAVAGGAEVVDHLELLLQRRIRAAVPSGDASDVCESDLARLARLALRSVAAESGAAIRLDARDLGRAAGDADLLWALFHCLFAAVVRSRPRRHDGATLVIRIAGDSAGRSVRLRVSRYGALARGRGLEELLLARRLIRRLGCRLEITARRGGARELRVEPLALPVALHRDPLALR